MQRRSALAPKDDPLLEKIPPLQNGDRLTRQEFERRYEAMPEVKKAELVEGVVYMVSPVNHRNHGRAHQDVAAWLGAYRASTPGVDGGLESTLILDERTKFSRMDSSASCPSAAERFGRRLRDTSREGRS